MKNNLWIIFAIISGFTGFLLGYSTPPLIEVGIKGGHSEIEVPVEQDSSSEQNLEEYYKKLQELQ